ncbi:hypothetical protein Poli38472_008308 [Pythium oligandrum]|uniref:Uncharacterized protein n=1 Tax=Pythium oligandrum TaxID=41045 RepID=A0A8K1CN39_PYTOL|nr:hypothetical protein Poli38472_008308 [Pythium oligandrum]|eukprot:TMW65666.1 hypothetical protein Poli38472_008308 [Pythium oligandrum]
MVVEMRTDCHADTTCLVYSNVNPSSFYRGMYAGKPVPQEANAPLPMAPSTVAMSGVGQAVKVSGEDTSDDYEWITLDESTAKPPAETKSTTALGQRQHSDEHEEPNPGMRRHTSPGDIEEGVDTTLPFTDFDLEMEDLWAFEESSLPPRPITPDNTRASYDMEVDEADEGDDEDEGSFVSLIQRTIFSGDGEISRRSTSSSGGMTDHSQETHATIEMSDDSDDENGSGVPSLAAFEALQQKLLELSGVGTSETITLETSGDDVHFLHIVCSIQSRCHAINKRLQSIPESRRHVFFPQWSSHSELLSTAMAEDKLRELMIDSMSADLHPVVRESAARQFKDACLVQASRDILQANMSDDLLRLIRHVLTDNNEGIVLVGTFILMEFMREAVRWDGLEDHELSQHLVLLSTGPHRPSIKWLVRRMLQAQA